MELPEHIKQKIEAYAKEYTPRDIELMERACSYYQEFFEQEIKERDEEINRYESAHEINQKQMLEIAAIAEDRLKEIERLKGLLDKLANGEALHVRKTGVGEYTVIFNSTDDAKKYYEENNFENNIYKTVYSK